jgi:hypothetical protein
MKVLWLLSLDLIRNDSVGGRVERVLLDTADTSTVLDTDSDVTLITPPGVPRVLDEVVGNTIEGTVADSEDGVVEAGTTRSTGDDTRLVVLEDGSVGLNGDGNGLLVEGGLELGGGLLGDKGVRFSTNTASVLTLLAGSISASVSVVRLVSEVVGLSVLVGVFLPATVATVVTVGSAVNELLLGERDELASGNEVSTLKTTSGWESPAGTAGALVLDGGDGTLVDPVNAGGKVLLREFDLVTHGEFVGWLVTEESLVLSMSVVREQVVLKGPGGLGVVVVGEDVSLSLQEALHSEFEFSTGTVGLAPFGNPFHESGLVGDSNSGESSGEFHL